MDHWSTFTKTEQFAAIGAEVVRASLWEYKDTDKFLGALERAFALIDASLDDPKWKREIGILLYVRDEIGKFYANQKSGIGTLYAAL